ncbi:AraC family transcriptional regulator [Chryseobacterium sp. JK1]|uniref:AraC family transcriptional regulator n=1 Tax=Chryseobacterium sp. JK1 TaxID=874294 RepID=UPI003D689D1A
MSRKSENIPVNMLHEESCGGIMLMRDSFHGSPNFEEVERSHRDSGYTFIIQEEGTTSIEIDFQTYDLQASSIIFIHPDQVHRLIAFNQALISTWIVTKENLRPEHLNLLEDLVPITPLTLDETSQSLLSEAFHLCMRISERKSTQLYHTVLKESCNTLVTLFASQYVSQNKSAGLHSRFEIITKEFRNVLEANFRKTSSPSEYASFLHISTSYLNECVKATTGKSVTFHIQQRIILEAKRMLFHSSKSVKEIAGDLGYDDYSYFIRLFVKVAGLTPAAFRELNRE